MFFHVFFRSCGQLFAGNFLQATHKRVSIVVGTFGNNDNIVVSNIVIIRTFSITTRCKYLKTLISKICTLWHLAGHFRFQKEKP